MFSITVKTLQDVSGARSKISKAIYDGLVGGSGNLRAELASDLSITDVERVCEVEYDLGLTNGKTIAPGGSLSDLVCGLKVAKKVTNNATSGVLADELYGGGAASDGARMMPRRTLMVLLKLASRTPPLTDTLSSTRPK